MFSTTAATKSGLDDWRFRSLRSGLTDVLYPSDRGYIAANVHLSSGAGPTFVRKFLAPAWVFTTKEGMTRHELKKAGHKSGLLFELEEPLSHAMGLNQALRLIGYGLRAHDSECAAAILALSDALENDRLAIFHHWKLGFATSARRMRRKQH